MIKVELTPAEGDFICHMFDVAIKGMIAFKTYANLQGEQLKQNEVQIASIKQVADGLKKKLSIAVMGSRSANDNGFEAGIFPKPPAS